MHLKYSRSHRYQRQVTLRYPRHDSPVAISARTAKKLARHFRISQEALIHLALRGLANTVWPIDELDESGYELNRPSDGITEDPGVCPFDDLSSLMRIRRGLFS